MNDQSTNNDSQPERFDRHEERRQRREARREALGMSGSGSGWIVGLVLILVGVGFLLQNMGIFSISLKNWWALFILIPAIGALETALRLYRSADNRLTAAARGSLVVGLVLTLVTVIFLFDLSWTIFGPILIILAGVGLLLSAMMPER
jgi:FtsH-binding integral membrane protein